MANSTSNLDLLSQSQASKEITVNALFDAVSPASLYGRQQSTTSGLTWGYYGGNVTIAGALVQIANGTISLSASNTNYVVAAKATGAVSFSTATTNWNNTTAYWRLYEIVSGASSVTSYTDAREMAKFTVDGAFGTIASQNADAVAITGGTADLDGLSVTGATQAVLLSRNAGATPSAETNTVLHLAGADGAGAKIILDCYGATGASPNFIYRKAEGVALSPSPVQLNSTLVNIAAFAYNGTAYAAASRLLCYADAAHSGTNASARWQMDLAPSGSTTVSAKYQWTATEHRPSTDNYSALGASSFRWSSSHVTDSYTYGKSALSPTRSTVASGSTITLTNSANHLLYDQAATVAALTVTLPSASLVDGQSITIATRSAITALTVNGGAIYGAPTTLAAGGFASFIYSSGGAAWFRKA